MEILKIIFGKQIPFWIETPIIIAFVPLMIVVPIWIGLASSVKRLHDHGMSGRWMLFLSLPIIS